MDRQYPPALLPVGTNYSGTYPPVVPPATLRPGLHQLQTLSLESIGPYSDQDDRNRAMLAPQGPQRSRKRQPQNSEHVKHRRTRSGCYTCRQRRVKCDENHPICDRCRKGKRECTYPGTTASPIATKPSRSESRLKGSPDASSPSDSDIEADERLPLSSIPDEGEDDIGEEENLSAASRSRQHSTSVIGIVDENMSNDVAKPSSRRHSTRPLPTRNNSKSTAKPEMSQGERWASLPTEIKFYLTYHRENMSHHHYTFKYDATDFLHTTFIEVALDNGSDALLYAIVAFAAYHHTISNDDGNISVFLSFYNKSISHLQQSIKTKQHSVATLLTILQLATIEEFLGDWLNLMGHQRAAYQILTDLFTPQTVMQDELRRYIINWYLRFDLFASMMAGAKTVLDRQWFAAALDYYKKQTMSNPNDLGARFEEYFATSRLLANDVSQLLASRTRENANEEQFSKDVQDLIAEFARFGNTIETAFSDSSCFVQSFHRAPLPSDDDVIDFRDPKFLYAGEFSTMNFVLMDHWAIDLTFRHQLTLLTGQQPTPGLVQLALKKCKMFEAIQLGGETGPAAVLGAQASLGILALFLPKDQKYTNWCRRKFADIERLGYLYPQSYRVRMSEIWGHDVTTWWLPNGHGYPTTLKLIKEFVEYRTPRTADTWASGVRDMNGVFGSLNIDEQGTGAHGLGDT